MQSKLRTYATLNIWVGAVDFLMIPSHHHAAVKPVACRSDVYFSGFDVGQKLSIADVRRSKDKPSVLLRVNAKKV